MLKVEQGGEALDPIQGYLQRVGAEVDISLREGVVQLPMGLEPKEIQPYYVAQDEWVAACQEAAEAEVSYAGLMGETSYPAPVKRGRLVINPGKRRSGYSLEEVYGKTLAAKRAAEVQKALTAQARALGDRLEGVEQPDAYCGMWQALVAPEYGQCTSANLDVLKYARVGHELLEAAREEEEQPTVVINARNQIPNNPAIAKSSLFVGTGFELITLPKSEKSVPPKGVWLRVNDATMLDYETRHFGFSSHDLDDGTWTPIKEPTIKRADSLIAGMIVATHEIKPSVDESFPALRGLIRGTASEAWQSLVKQWYWDETKQPPIVLTGQEATTFFESMPENYFESKEGLRAAFKVIEQDRRDEEVRHMLGEVAVNPDDYFV